MGRSLSHLLCLLGLLIVSMAPVTAQVPKIAVDPRVELMSILFRLAGNPEYRQGRVPRYNQAIDAYFAPVRNHPAVLLARRLRAEDGVSYDAVMSMAVHLQDPYDLKERVPFDRPGIALDARWKGAKAREFLKLARRFVQESRFREFVQSQRALYDTTSERMRALAEKQVDFAWFNRFFGTPPGARFVLVPGLANGYGSFGPKFRAANGSEELFAIVGVADVDPTGTPQFGADMIPLIVHEFNHSYVNPIAEKESAGFQKAGARVFGAVADAMRRQACAEWKIMVNESLVRATAARYVRAHQGPEAAAAEVQAERARGFLWTGELFDLLGEYERERERYPTFRAFMPRVIAYFDQLAPRVDEMVRRYDEERPRLLSMTPENGSATVDPALAELVFRFDRPMKSGYSVMRSGEAGAERSPKVLGVGFDESRTVFTMRVQLEPERLYEFSLNSEAGGSFQSREGVPLKRLPVRFRTGPRKP